MSGTTGSVCVLKPGKAWIAAVGDSASILISQRGDEPPSWRLLSGDHRLTNEKEKQRVIEAGARVAKRGNQSKGHLRIWLPELDTPGLMVTRSLGDAIGKTVGVISEPEVQIVDLGPSQRYIVMASDGVWDVLSHDRVTEIVTSAKSGTEAAETIVQASLAAWHSKKNETEAKVGKPVRGIGDNITALVVDLAPWLTA